MRLCKALQRSNARSGQCSRIIAPYFSRRHFANDQAQGDHPPNPTNDTNDTSGQLASDRDDAFKINPENKTVETAVGELPLSPLMDPTYWEATRRYQLPKAKPRKPKNSVERQLRANPFARALATPIRMCALTRIRLPSFFLQDFNLVAHPETGAPWVIPHSPIPELPLAKGPEVKETSEITNEPGSEETDAIIPDIESELDKLQEQDPEDTASTEEKRRYGPAVYVLARRDVLAAFSTKRSGLENSHRRIMGSNQRYKSLAGKAVWRKDMDSYILDLMRHDVVSNILYLSRLCVENGRYYIVKCYGWNDVKYKHKGSVLWFGEPEEGPQANNEPGPFATFDIEKTDIEGEKYTTTVAVHNMPRLLGPEQVKAVKEEAGALQNGSLFMLAGRRTTELQMKLWELEGYLADYRDDA